MAMQPQSSGWRALRLVGQSGSAMKTVWWAPAVGRHNVPGIRPALVLLHLREIDGKYFQSGFLCLGCNGGLPRAPSDSMLGVRARANFFFPALVAYIQH